MFSGTGSAVARPGTSSGTGTVGGNITGTGAGTQSAGTSDAIGVLANPPAPVIRPYGGGLFFIHPSEAAPVSGRGHSVATSGESSAHGELIFVGLARGTATPGRSAAKGTITEKAKRPRNQPPTRPTDEPKTTMANEESLSIAREKEDEEAILQFASDFFNR